MAFRRQVKNFVKNYSDAEMKVREATSNDPWGPSSSLMLEISDLTFNTISLSEIMNMLWQRLSDHGKNWRHVYKSLTLMDYLIKNGSKKVIQHCREGFFNLQMLKDFQHIDEAGKDQENTSKGRLKQEQYQEFQLPAETMLSQETLPPLEGNAWKSTDDLILFSDEDPKPSLPVAPPSVTSPTTCSSDGKVEASNLGDADAMPTSSEKCSSLQINVTLDKESENTISNTVIENPLQTPQGKQEPIKSVEMLTTLPAFCSSSKEEFISPNLRISKSDSAFYNWSSVETLYVSPSFKTVNPVKEIVISKDHQKPTQASIVQMDNEDLKTLTTWVSTASASEGTSSFSAASVSPSDAAPSEKPVLHVPPALPRPSLWALPHPRRSAASTKRRGKTAGAHYPFAPRALSSDEEEEDNLSPLEILPDNSDSAKNKTSRISSSDWVAFPTQNVDSMPSVSCSSFQPTQGNLPREPEANSSIKVLLEEVKSAIVRLHEDLSTVIQELNIISSHLVSMSGTSLQVGKSV
ncbi:ENTH domain-containing protein 1 isoform X3 [Fukomys damarensis]|uniref:ENTH domain-containing protein 1 isoform X3 n=1 Tax=Fukomys damarensis TaxID=885580 RepID=UPI00053FD960|nr:ENTH domain-containing protein 1 isoform X3 [Fukomys damarensis]